MSESDDTRVLNMRINNKEFLKGTADSLKALDTLNKGVDNAGKGKGMQTMSKNVETVKTKFGAMQIAGVTALATITNKAVNAGLRLAKGLAIDPILDGWREYNKLLTSTQTIQANTGKSTAVVGKYLNQLNRYSDQTIYNFGQMADNIGKFTAAGVGIEDATSSIKGLANSAALFGSDANQLNTAMYQMSQALAAGTIKLMDWNSLANAGMGGKNMRDSLMATARTLGDHGKAMDAAMKKNGNFRDSLHEGWLSGKIFNKTMEVMAGTQNKWGKTVAYSVEQLKGMGYTTKAAKELHRLSQASIDSATQIKTFGQLIDVVKESIGSGWAGIFQSLFGNLEEAKKMWTDVGQTVTGFISLVFGKVQTMLTQWRSLKDAQSGLNGFQLFWQGLGNIFKSVGNLLHPIVTLITSLFPASQSAGSGMFTLSQGFYRFSVFLEKVTSGTSKLDPVLKVLGGTIRFLFGIVGKILGLFFDFVGALGPLGPVISEAAVAFGQLFTALLKMTKLDEGLFNLLERGKQMGADLIAGLREGLSSGSMTDTIAGWVNGFVNFFKGLLGIHSPSTVFAEFGKNIVEGLVNGVLGAISLIGKAISAIGGSIGNLDKYDLAGIISVIFSAGALLIAVKFIKSISGIFNQLHAVFGNVNGLLNQTTNTLKTMQNSVRAKMILNIAIAVGILTASLLVLSKIPADEMKKGLAGMAAAMTLLVGAMVVMNKAGGGVTLFATASGLTALATAMLILSGAVLAFGSMKPDVLKQGLIGMAIGLTAVTIALAALGAIGPAVLAGGAAMVLAAGSMVILAAALTALAGVVLLFSQIDPGKFGSGLLKMAATLVVLGLAMIPLAAAAPMVLVASAALVVLAAAMTMMLGVIGIFAKTSWDTIWSGVLKIAAAIVVIGLAGAVAAPGLIALGLAAVLIGAGLLAAGVGMALFGAGLAAVAAAGLAAGAVLATAFEGFLAMLPLMATQLVAALAAFMAALAHYAPGIVDSIVKIGSELLRGLAELSPKIADTAVGILMDFVDAIIAGKQHLFDAGLDMIQGFLDSLNEKLPDLIQSGIDLIDHIIRGIGDGAEQLVTAAGETILSFLNAVNDAVVLYEPQILAVGLSIGKNLILGLVQGLVPEPILTAFTNFVNTVVNFFKGLLGINSPSTVFAGFGRNIVEGLVNGVRGAIGLVTSVVSSLVGGAINIVQGLPGKARAALSGLGGILKSVFGGAFKSASSAVSNGVSNIGSAIGKIPGLIRSALSSAGNAAKALGNAIVDGIKKGLGKAVGAVGNLGSTLIRALKDAINSALNLPFNIPKLTLKIGPKHFSIGGQQLIPRFAKGVTGFSGGAALVGEVGPEMVTMGRGANVITNDKLTAFMKAVAVLTRAMTKGSAQNSPGGNIQFAVSADFRGDPRARGVEFAANLTAGLVNGLRSNQSVINSTMAGVGDSMSQSFADVLGIRSPSTVFLKYAGYVGAGFINGLLASVASVQKAATTLGEAAISAIAKTITDGQLQLESVRAKADAYADAAAELRAKARRTKNKKRRAQLLAAAKALEKKSAAEQKIAAKQAAKVEAENAAAERKAAFEAADTQGKADMRKEDAQTAAEKASAAREAAIRLSKEADLVRKYDKARAAELDKLAQAQLAKSKTYADQAAAYAKEAYDLSEQAKLEGPGGPADMAAQIQSVTAEQVAAAQAVFDDFAKRLADAQELALEGASSTSETSFVQNNYSPEAISAADAYRGLKSLVSIAERKLTNTGS